MHTVKPQFVIVIACVIMVVMFCCKSGSCQLTQAPPAAIEPPTPDQNASTLLETRCSVCHSANKPKRAKNTLEKWQKTVDRMVSKGAKLTEAEKTVLVDYLVKFYGQNQKLEGLDLQ